METLITVPLYVWENASDDRRNMEIIREARRVREPISDRLMDIICGLQVGEKTAKERAIESVENSNKKTVGQLYEDFLDENYEPDKEPPSESTPPKNIPPAVWVAVPQGKRESTKEK